MVSTAKRLSAALLAVVFSLFSVVIPVSAHAATYNASSNLTGRQWTVVGQGTGLAGNPILATAATMLGRANPWVAAITLGTPVMQYLLEKNDGSKVAIRAKDAPVATPSGWTTNPNGIPSPPSTATPVGGTPYAATSSTPSVQNCWVPVGGGTGSSCLSDAEALAWCQANVHPAATFPYSASGGCARYGYYNGPTLGSSCAGVVVAAGATCSPVLSCPNGGTLSGSTCIPDPTCSPGYAMSQGYCTIIDPTAVKWPADSIPTYIPNDSGTGFIPDPRDPDPIPATPTTPEIQNPTNDYSKDQYGNPASISIQPQSGGGYKVDQRVQTTNNNQTTTTINNITVNNAGTVINISSTTIPGPIETAAPGATPAAQSSQLPTDYAREATLQQSVQKLDDIKTGAGAADAPNYQVDQKKLDMNQELKDKADAIPGQYTGDKGNWFSWVWTPPIGACTPWSSTIHGQSVSWNVCPYIDNIRDVIGYLLAIGTTWGVYLQLFRRED